MHDTQQNPWSFYSAEAKCQADICNRMLHQSVIVVFVVIIIIIMLHTNFSHIQSFLSPFLDITHSLSVRNSSEHTTMVDKSTQLPK